jgi:hypothetical protein
VLLAFSIPWDTAYVNGDVLRSHKPLPVRLGDSSGELVTNGVEAVRDGILQAAHGGNRAETNQCCNQRVLDQILAGLFRHQVHGNLLDVLHFF